MPVVDTDFSTKAGDHLFARLNYDEALAVASAHGAKLIAHAEVEAVRSVGVQLVPFLGTPRAENEIAHSIAHDESVWAQLRSLGWNGRVPVCGAGKHWIDGAPPGRSRLMGWDKDGPGPSKAWWQPDSVAHNREHFDDGTTTMLVRPTGGRKTLEGLWDELVATATGAALSLADSVAAAAESAPERHLARALAEVGVHETPGPASTARIDEYLATAIRGGVPLNLRGDSEFSWCAAFASWCGLPDGMTPRASVAELIADARKLGLWRSGDVWHDPKPGDLACYARGGGDPRKGGLGHVNRCIEQVGGSKFRAVGGNETHPSGGAVNVSVRPLTEPIGWIVYEKKGD